MDILKFVIQFFIVLTIPCVEQGVLEILTISLRMFITALEKWRTFIMWAVLIIEFLVYLLSRSLYMWL